MKPLSYVAAPYAAETPELVAWNVARAVLLARVLVSEGRAPVLIHPVIAPVFGVETPASRAVGIACDCAIVSAVAARNGAEFVALLRDDDTCSTGMSAEYAAWCDVRRQVLRDLPRATAPGVRAGNWRWWRQACARAGLLSEWAELLDAPGNAAPVDALAAANARLREMGSREEDLEAEIERLGGVEARVEERVKAARVDGARGMQRAVIDHLSRATAQMLTFQQEAAMIAAIDPATVGGGS